MDARMSDFGASPCSASQTELLLTGPSVDLSNIEDDGAAFGHALALSVLQAGLSPVSCPLVPFLVLLVKQGPQWRWLVGQILSALGQWIDNGALAKGS